MCDGHPDLAVPPESHFVVQLAPRRRDAAAARSTSPRSSISLPRASGSDCGSSTASRSPTRSRRRRPTDYPQAVRTVFGLWATTRGKARYADKTPGVRPPHSRRWRGCSRRRRSSTWSATGATWRRSFLELGWADTIEEAAMHWRLRVRRGRRAGRTLPAGRYLELRYEDLVARSRRPAPRPVRDDRAAVLHGDARSLRPGRRGHPHDRPSRVPPALAIPPTPGLRDWRRRAERPRTSPASSCSPATR